ncbi:helix-turn-helix domain-containing protein [Nocardia terpenica]|uniref:helix-turn-helix domain-containing protein n=1 Tax=Nocardia terpenica TaxID=455432 RepID=UPI001E39B058|nr:helix-turn-helix transcriptional regulator [Nocardia terpenica]
MSSEAPGPSLPHRQMGQYLRRAREDQDLTQGQVAESLGWSVSTQSRLERGETGRIRDRDIEHLCRTLGFDDEKTAAMVGLFKQGGERRWWHAFGDVIPETFNVYIGLESNACKIEVYRPDIVPGILQTAEYAAVLDRIYFPSDSEEELQRRIELKMKRQNIITRRLDPVSIEVIINEGALRILVGTPTIMANLCRHLADWSTRPNITIRILPSSAGYPVGGPVGPFAILEFPRDREGAPVEPTVIYVETFTGDMYLEDESDVRKYRMAWTKVQHAALDTVASRRLLRQLAQRSSWREH